MSNDNAVTGHNLDTSEGARAYVAEFFANQVRRHDFRAYITTRLAADFACALAKHLAAQPSPAGQGDALEVELLSQAARLERRAVEDRETGESIEQAIENGEGYTPDEATDVAAGLQHDADCGEEIASLLRRAAATLSARQPVGQEPVVVAHRFIQNHQGLEHTIWMDGDASESEVEAERAGIGRVERAYAAPPAQAVDLGQFRECVELMEWQERGHANPDWPVGDPKKHAEALRLLSLIDSQAVRNG